MSICGFSPASWITRSASSATRIGLPMSSTKIWPLARVSVMPWPAACRISRDASGMVMKKRVICGWVTVSGPPFSSCERNSGITEPVEPRTLPKRTVMKRVAS